MRLMSIYGGKKWMKKKKRQLRATRGIINTSSLRQRNLLKMNIIMKVAYRSTTESFPWPGGRTLGYSKEMKRENQATELDSVFFFFFFANLIILLHRWGERTSCGYLERFLEYAGTNNTYPAHISHTGATSLLPGVDIYLSICVIEPVIN